MIAQMLVGMLLCLLVWGGVWMIGAAPTVFGFVLGFVVGCCVTLLVALWLFGRGGG